MNNGTRHRRKRPNHRTERGKCGGAAGREALIKGHPPQLSEALETGERGGEERHMELGETARGRLLVVVWTWRLGTVRVVTAFPVKPKLRAFYRRVQKGGTSG